MPPPMSTIASSLGGREDIIPQSQDEPVEFRTMPILEKISHEGQDRHIWGLLFNPGFKKLKEV